MQSQPNSTEEKLIFIADIERTLFGALIKLRRKRDKRKMARAVKPSNEEKLNLLMKLKKMTTLQMRFVNQIYFNSTNDIIDIRTLDLTLFDAVNEVADILLFINNERAYASQAK